jgi:hypothetical protein
MYSHDKYKNFPSVRILCESIGSTTVTMICFCEVNILLQLNNHPQYYSILHNTVTINKISWFTSVNILNRKHQSNCINMHHLTPAAFYQYNSSNASSYWFVNSSCLYLQSPSLCQIQYLTHKLIIFSKPIGTSIFTQTFKRCMEYVHISNWKTGSSNTVLTHTSKLWHH